VYKLPTLSTLIQLIFSHSKSCEFFYFKIAHLFIGVMLKTEIFDFTLHGEIGVGEVAVLLHGEVVVGEVALGKLVTGEVSVGEVAVGETSDWGS